MAVNKQKDYEAIGRQNITQPSKVKNRLPRILVYGRNKKGKTRFCMSAGQGKILVIDPEHGTDEMTKLDPHVWHVSTWEELDDVYKFLKLGKHEYQWIALDGMTKIHNMALRWVMNMMEEADLDRKPGLVQQRDYGRAGEMTKGLLWNFHNLPYGLIVTAQERMEQPMSQGEDDDADVEEATAAYVPDLPKGARSTVNSIVSVIGRIYTVKTEIKKRDPKTKEIVEAMGIQRRLWLEPHPAYDTGYRSEFNLPPFIKNPTVPKLVQLIREGRVTNG
jgi:hypothetical protein